MTNRMGIEGIVISPILPWINQLNGSRPNGKQMKLEDQVCSLELAKKLKELGVKQESLWVYVTGAEQGDKPLIVLAGWFEETPIVPAFTVAELGERIMTSEDLDLPWYGNGVWFWSALGKDGNENTEADARAKMLIYLLEYRLITL
jgi:hypothetical protein